MATKTVEENAADETLEFQVSDELYQISEATNRDGTVNVHVYDFEKYEMGSGSKRVRVHFRTPTGEEKEEKMDWPRRDTAEYKFVRLCRQTVGGLNAADFIKQDGAEIKADPKEWELVVEESSFKRAWRTVGFPTLREVVKGGITLMVIGIAIAFGLGVVIPPALGLLTVGGVITPIATGTAMFTTMVVSAFVGFAYLFPAVLTIEALWDLED